MSGSIPFSRVGMYLAFDTSSPAGSVAVGQGSEVLARVLLERRAEHAARLVPAIDTVLEEAGVDRTELSGVVVGEGPGSFTGVRVAAATAKGLTHALSLPLWVVSSLAAAALASSAGPIRYALFDARSDRVYGACYGVGSSAVQTLVSPHAGTLRDVLDGDVPGGVTFIGDAADRHRAVIEGAGYPVADRNESASLADGLLRYLGLCPDRGPIENIEAWQPAYLRPSRAEAAWTP